MDVELAGDNTPTVFPACVVTSAAARKARMNQDKEMGECEEGVVNTQPKRGIDKPVSTIPNSFTLGLEAKNRSPTFLKEQMLNSVT